MKKLNVILTLILAWIGVANSTAQLSNADQLTAVIGSSSATSMATGSYYVLQNRATSEYLIDNNGTFATTTALPASGDADADIIFPYLFTLTSQGYIQSAAGHNLPQLSADYTLNDGTVGDGRQFAPRRAAAGTNGVYSVSAGTSSGYLYLSSNGLFLNCDLLGAEVQGTYSDWQVTLVSLIERGTSTDCYVTYIYMNGTTEWYRETSTVTVGDPYPELYSAGTGVRYLNIPTGTVSASETVTIQCEATAECPVKIFSADFASAKWVYLFFHTYAYHLQYKNGQNYITVNTGQTTRPSNTTSNYGYQWAFIGNPLAGFKIVNRAAGSGKILVSAAPSSTNSGGDTYPLMMDETGVDTDTYNKTWNFTERYFGLLLSRPGETVYANNRSGKLSYWTGTDYGSTLSVEPVDLSLTATTLDTSKKYMLINKFTGKALADKLVDDTHVAYPIEPNASDHYCIWTVEKSGNYYRFKSYGSAENSETYYIGTATPSGDPIYYVALTSTASSGNYYVRDAIDDGYSYLMTSISTTTGATERVALADNYGQYTTFGTPYSSMEEWEIREVTPEEPITYVSSISSGKYYRFYNYSYNTLSMTDAGDNKVSTSTSSADNYAQVWKLTSSGSGYKMQNLWTGNYLQNNSTNSTQYTTGSTAKAFTYTTGTDDSSNTYFLFAPYLHCAASQSYWVVYWGASDSEASRWYLEEVTISDDDLAAIEEARTLVNNASSYTSTLSTFFSDYACTTLKSTYQSKTDAQLRSAMSSLPTALQEMAVRVKNDTWNSNATFNTYEKDFRIHSYEIFSNCDLWYSKLKTGRFARLSNPTGIQLSAGEVAYIFVDANVKDSNASLEAELVTGTNRSGNTKTLTRGCNAVYATDDCEIFITYLLNNVDKSCDDYPDIKVHIEGGTCNGCFDMRRGHTNNDWMWLKENMFQNKYLHVKGNSVMLNVYFDRVKAASNATGVMKIWDFIFDTEEHLSGSDQYKETGQYKMMVNPYDNGTSGTNPYWSDSGHGSSHPGIYSDGLFSYDALSNVGTNGGHIWVIEHELGHGHQAPINMAGTTESSNNSLAQCVNLLAKDSPLFQSTRSSRGYGVNGLVSRFNSGYSWIDYASFRTQDGEDSDLWISNHMIFQLWLYFDYLGNYTPASGTNTGFSFMSDLYDALRSDPITKSSSSTNPGLASKDYLLIAKYAAQITQTDLSEFFQAWGFWETTPTVSVTNDVASTNTWYMGDYGNYYLRTAASYVNSVKTTMQSYSKKNGNILFIEDRCTGSTLPSYIDYDPTFFGETGYYETFDKLITKAYNYELSGTTVTMVDGTGAVGFKIYDASGNLVYISNTNTFTVSQAIATGLTNGTYTLVAAQGDGTDFAMGECNKVGYDVDNDDHTTFADVTAIAHILTGCTSDPTSGKAYNMEAADVNGVGGVTIADLTSLVNWLTINGEK